MRILQTFRRNGFVIFFILHLIFLSSNNFYSTFIFRSQPVIDTSFSPRRFNSILPDVFDPNQFSGSRNKFSPKIQRINDTNEAFQAIYDLVNPQTIIDKELTGENVTIAILDSGINEVGWITNDITKFTAISNSTQVNDDNGHGTFVGSIISKIAPNATLISIKVSDSEFTKSEWIEEGFKLALINNASIIHASLGTTQLEALNSSLITNLSDFNITTVISAGNMGPYSASMSSPAIFSETIAVGMAYNQTTIHFSSSNGPRPSGAMGPDIVAPGVEIIGYDHKGQLCNKTGTSFAAPFVTGALALLKEAFPKASPTALKAALLETALFMNSTSPIRQGNGFLDISKAYKLLNTIYINASNPNPLFTFAPRGLSSDFLYFGHAVNGVNRTYRISLYSTIDSNLTEITMNQTFPSVNNSKFPFDISVGDLPRNITTGLNYIDLSLTIPEDLSMARREGIITFQFSNGKKIYSSNLSLTIENRYPSGNILFYQGYDNDSFIPDGPTGRFNQLQYFLEWYYGMNTKGAIRPNSLIETIGPLIATENISGRITRQDLKNQHILVLADIEFGITDQEITLIQEWISEGHSLLVLSYPSQKYQGTEILSNQTAINKLIETYGLRIENDSTNLSRFLWATTSISDPIFEEKDWSFDYIGTSIKISPEKGGHILATATKNNTSQEYPIAGYWEDPDSKGKVVVFGGIFPFDDLGILNLERDNLEVISRIFRWMIQDQQVSLDIILTSSPSTGGSTTIQITIDDPAFTESHFNGTIMEANGSFTQIMFKKSANIYVASWKPLAAGQAIIWFNLRVPGKAPTNGVFVLDVSDTSSQNLFFLFIIGGFILLGIVYYLLASRQPQRRSPIEQRVALELKRQKSDSQHIGLETLETCAQCGTKRYSNESKYCFKCGKEL
ncbi:MAG: S8 family serine peptidase [Promethearchaeota archaeon]